MKILSIDVGIKNLALCLFSKLDNNNNNEFTIAKWDVVNISEEETFLCQVPDTKDKTICGKPAKFKKNHLCYCLKHSKKQSFQIPTSELKPSFINKQKIQSLFDLAEKHKIPYEKPIKKNDLVQLFQEYIHNTCFDPIVNTNASKVDLISIGKNIKTKLDALFADESIDIILIENQISPIANRMKTIQGMIAQYFIMRNPDTHPLQIEFISSSNKLKDCSEELKTNYSDRKKLGVAKTLEALNESHQFQSYHDFFFKSKKKDDLADCFLQGIWFIHNKLSVFK